MYMYMYMYMYIVRLHVDYYKKPVCFRKHVHTCTFTCMLMYTYVHMHVHVHVHVHVLFPERHKFLVMYKTFEPLHQLTMYMYMTHMYMYMYVRTCRFQLCSMLNDSMYMYM